MQSEKRSEWIAELAKVAQVVQGSASRKSFSADPMGTLERAGVRADVLPEGVIDALSELSYEELGVLVRLNDAFVSSGMVIDDEYGGRLGFF